MMRSICSVLACGLLLLAASDAAGADVNAPKVLLDPAADGSADLVQFNGDKSDQSWTVKDGGIDVSIIPNGKYSFPGIRIVPKSPWDAKGYGHVEAKITNTGAKPLRLTLRVDNEGPWQENRWNGNALTIKPGQSGTISTIFGYSWGGPGYALNPAAITQAVIFTGKSDVAQSFRVEAIKAAGPAGERPYVNPNTVATRPDGGQVLGGQATFDAAKQVATKGGAKIAASDATSLTVAFTGQADQSVTIKPVAGMWNLRDHLQVRVRMKNIGTTALKPGVRLESKGGNSDVISTSKPIEPGGETEIVVPFVPATPWKGADLPEMLVEAGPKRDFHEFVPGTGTKYTSNKTTGVSVIAGKQTGSLQITSILADMPARQPLPDWLGKKPPVDGDWSLTFEDNFDGTAIDLKKWNIYSEGEWHLGKATGWSKDNVIVKDGKLHLRVERRKVRHNDNPAYALHDYAAGNCDTYGKWTQRYGYFEARLRLPSAPNAFTAFWMMPDRGLEYAMSDKTAFGESRRYMRNSTNGFGMEFDIMEQLSIWGPNRHDFGMHWDHYMEHHKAIGTFGCYFQPDTDGYLTVGMLWTPGSVIMYQQGNESARWETKRISSIPSYFILQHITGGWETEGMDDRTLPSDMLFDYVRAWQRKDLASPVDGPKANDGGPLPPKAPATAPASAPK